MNKPATSDRPPIELLAPAGDWECVSAAIENGADAIYFGLDCGFNARFRAQNFGVRDLPRLTETLRSRGVRGYVTMNTLVFPSEMPSLVDTIAAVAEAGIDAVLVQDFGVARIVREVCPQLEIHASTQMSLTSAETIEVAKQLGITRAVLARELSIAEIRKIAAGTDMPLEVFIHGALCVAYSGQCLTSESLGGRSANRGQCAQACRLPYELICDGEDVPLGEVKYLLSPQDLAGYAAIPDLIDAGVASIKIEGRLKTPEYVANITKHYRQAIEQATQTGLVAIADRDRQEMELSFSRGFSPGWLEGNDHKRLVPGIHNAKRGIELGRVLQVGHQQIQVKLKADVQLGDGLAIQTPADESETENRGQGGRVYGLTDSQGRSQKSLSAGTIAWIEFGRGAIDWTLVDEHQTVFKNDDPQLNRRLRHSFEQKSPAQTRPIDLLVKASVGQPLEVTGEVTDGGARNVSAKVVGPEPLSAANNRPITEDVLRDKLGRMGGTAFKLGKLTMDIDGGPMVPMAMLNETRRQLVSLLEEKLRHAPVKVVNAEAGRRLLDAIELPSPNESATNPKIAVLCRTLEQVRAACETKADYIYTDFADIRRYGDAVEIAHAKQCPIAIATVRMQKPGEMGLMKVLTRHNPDAILVRNLAAIEYFRDKAPAMIADFSLNIANHRSAQWLMSLGVSRFTASYDLNRNQLMELVGSIPSSWLEVVIHQHMPMFHMEHCVFCSVLSPGTNKTNCGRPCDDHVVQLRDRVGAEHTLQADVACRNTLFNSTPQSGAEIVSELRENEVGWFRIELLEEDAAQANTTISLYRRLLNGEIDGSNVWQQLNASNRVGVTRGTLEEKRNPLTIL
ncbi:putative protease YhbU precursor [Rubripirellula amarantea]|uniref:Putative protease YhbU n=1 Tax=Rubripirellula amarantea TaxID=2527999 RepID=A0A5C5WWC5_9BACT|nr:U32 family peptidase [Rubripirellula amarantea]TWT54162.1 putative protease YhbU precursor [Rubripirellula amarantea]